MSTKNNKTETTNKDIYKELFKYEDLPTHYAKIAYNNLKEIALNKLLKMGFSKEEIMSTEKYNTNMLDYEIKNETEKTLYSHHNGFYYSVKLEKLRQTTV